MKKKSLKSLSLKKSKVASISGGLANSQAQAQQAQSDDHPLTFTVTLPSGTIILTMHTIDPWRCRTMSCNSKCEWCDIIFG